jgi:hypothetical protein
MPKGLTFEHFVVARLGLHGDGEEDCD